MDYLKLVFSEKYFDKNYSTLGNGINCMESAFGECLKRYKGDVHEEWLSLLFEICIKCKDKYTMDMLISECNDDEKIKAILESNYAKIKDYPTHIDATDK